MCPVEMSSNLREVAQCPETLLNGEIGLNMFKLELREGSLTLTALVGRCGDVPWAEVVV